MRYSGLWLTDHDSGHLAIGSTTKGFPQSARCQDERENRCDPERDERPDPEQSSRGRRNTAAGNPSRRPEVNKRDKGPK